MRPVRPALLTILCVLGFLGAFLKYFLVLSPPVQEIGRAYALYLSLSTVFEILCLASLWSMRKWAVWGYLAYFLVHQGVHLWIGEWRWFAFLLQTALALTALAYYRRMLPRG